MVARAPGFLRSSWFYYSLAALLAVVGLVSMVEVQVPPREVGTAADLATLRERDDTNLILIVVDTLRADHLGAYGYARDTSPMLDQMAATGIRFAHTRAQSTWTKSSMASLWTGVQPFAAEITDFTHALDDSVVLPAERLREAGFRTAGFYRNAWIAPNFGFGQGFDFYLFPTPNLTPDRLEQNAPGKSGLEGSDYDVTEIAMEFLRAHGHERFFLYLHTMDVHQYQYESDSALFGTRYVDAYDNAIHWTDRNVGLLVAELMELDLLEETIIVVAADHGEEFHEHGGEGHARNLYRETTEVPLILSLPFALAEPVVVDSWVENNDIWPTLFDLLGLEPMEHHPGRSLRPAIEAAAAGEEDPEAAARPVMAQINVNWGRDVPEKRLVSLTQGSWRVIFDPEDPQASAELYDLATDPGEQEDLAARHPERVAELLEPARARLARTPEASLSKDVEVDALQLQQLRALGYVVEEK